MSSQLLEAVQQKVALSTQVIITMSRYQCLITNTKWCVIVIDNAFMITVSWKPWVMGGQNVLSWSTAVMMIIVKFATDSFFSFTIFTIQRLYCHVLIVKLFLALMHYQSELFDPAGYISNVPWNFVSLQVNEPLWLSEHVRCTLITPSRNQPTKWLNTIYYTTLAIWLELSLHYPLNPNLASTSIMP